MGIKGLFQLIKSETKDTWHEATREKYSGKVVAIDASILLYQFLTQIRTKGSGYSQELLTDENGEVTSHLQGFFNRAANLAEHGIKAIYVFDGKPPVLKFKELMRRKELRAKAEHEVGDLIEQIEHGEEEGENVEEVIDELNKIEKRTVRITAKQIEEVKSLLTLMGIPVVTAPCEAEAQCAELVKSGKAYAAATEDMDSLTFGANIVLRKLTTPASAKEKVIEINTVKVLTGLGLTHDQFVDLCILSGCDYCETIRGVGPKTALKFIKKYGSIENVIMNTCDKYEIPDQFQDTEFLKQVRNLFKHPIVTPAEEIEISFGRPDREGITKFLVEDRNFSLERVNKVLDKVRRSMGSNVSKIARNLGGLGGPGKTDEKQPTIDSFFKITKTSSNLRN